jgi:hypothetical protein
MLDRPDLEALRDRVAAELSDSEQLPENDDLLEAIRQTRIDRNIAIATINEVTAGLYKGVYCYVSDVERVVGDRFSVVRGKLLSLPTKLVRVIRGLKPEQIEEVIREEIQDISKEIKPFEPSDFRSRGFTESPEDSILETE